MKRYFQALSFEHNPTSLALLVWSVLWQICFCRGTFLESVAIILELVRFTLELVGIILESVRIILESIGTISQYHSWVSWDHPWGSQTVGQRMGFVCTFTYSHEQASKQGSEQANKGVSKQTSEQASEPVCDLFFPNASFRKSVKAIHESDWTILESVEPFLNVFHDCLSDPGTWAFRDLKIYGGTWNEFCVSDLKSWVVIDRQLPHCCDWVGAERWSTCTF